MKNKTNSKSEDQEYIEDRPDVKADKEYDCFVTAEHKKFMENIWKNEFADRYNRPAKMVPKDKKPKGKSQATEEVREYNRNWYGKHPWAKTYKRAQTRCLHDKNSSYYKRGIKFELTSDDVKELWGRDGADQLRKPSINRIDGSLGYSKDNCEIIELQDNLEKKRSKRWASVSGDF